MIDVSNIIVVYITHNYECMNSEFIEELKLAIMELEFNNI